MTSEPEIYARTTSNRRMLAEVLEELDAGQWDAPTLCEGWTVRHLAAHLLQPMLIGFGRFFVTSLLHRGDTDRTVDDLTRRLAKRSPQELVRLLRAHAADRIDPPRVGPMGPFAETCIHLRDIARPLGLDADVPIDHWRVLLDYLTSASVASSLVPQGRLDGLMLQATDAEWQSGSGQEVTGALEAIAMAATGRQAALAYLDGPGAQVLRRRLLAPRARQGA